jgi:hypothetical protein
MKLKFILKSVSLFLLLISAIFVFACQTTDAGANGELADAYKKLYAAVKANNTDQIKQIMSKNSLTLAEFAGSQQKKPIEEVLKNGFTATTFAETLPKMRDERIKDDFGALEVWNEKDKRWEDLPFIKEDGVWKFAMGDMFKGSYVSPGKGKSIIEQEAANAANPNLVPAAPPTNMNGVATTNANVGNVGNVNTIQVDPIKPKEDKKKVK